MNRCDTCLKPSQDGKNVGRLVPYGNGKGMYTVETFTCSKCIQGLLKRKNRKEN